jgi:hypothetical protein
MDDITNVVMSVGKQSQRFVFLPSQKYVHCFKFKIVMCNKGYMRGYIHFRISQNLC